FLQKVSLHNNHKHIHFPGKERRPPPNTDRGRRLADQLTITADENGSRLQDVLAGRYPAFSVGSLLRLIAAGSVLHNGGRASRRAKMQEGDGVDVAFPEEGLRQIIPRKIDLEVLHEDASCVVINKRAGLAVVPERGAKGNPLMSGLLHYFQHESPLATGELIRPMIVHRLDKDTTGALVIARSLPAQRFLTEQFESRSVRKEYIAIVRGRPPEEMEITLPISTRGVKRGRAIVSERTGRPARTIVRAEEYFGRFAVVRAIPKTWRIHQVRLHLKAAGYPLVVDPLYSGPRGAEPAFRLSEFKPGYRPKSGRVEKPLIARQALHAHRLGFESYAAPGESVLVEAPLPADMVLVLKMLRKFCGDG
ncbi:MAG: RluA family pseudouridine synthase, partial [Planctomycetes bacterium]|nr:RluA family pseudouridine synthase [Planctomycetota bacterium]